MKPLTEYANTYKGAAMLAFDSWNELYALGAREDHEDEAIRAGRMMAYGHILRHITRRSTSQYWKEVIDAM